MYKQRVVIFSNGVRWKKALALIKSGDIVIGVDAAAYWLLQAGVAVVAAVGDFDSLTAEQFVLVKQHVKQIVAVEPHPKYQTDMEMAFEFAEKLNPKEILVLWALGKRFDQTLANFYLLEKLMLKHITVIIQDEYSRIQLVKKTIFFSKSEYKYVSILPLTETATVSLEGFLYDVQNQNLLRGETLGVSNEIIHKKAAVMVHAGIVALVESRD